MILATTRLIKQHSLILRINWSYSMKYQIDSSILKYLFFLKIEYLIFHSYNFIQYMAV